MSTWLRLNTFTAMIYLLAVGGCSSGPRPLLPAIDAEQFILYSIDSGFPPDAPPHRGEFFHGDPVLGKIEIADQQTRHKLVKAFKDGVAPGEDLRGAGCYWPRHAIRTIHKGQTTDWVICFQCYQYKVHTSDGESGYLVVRRTPKPAFDEVLKAAKIKLAKPAIEE